MAGPITWRNVSSTASGGAPSLLAQGQQQVQQGLQALGNLVRSNVEQQRSNQAAIRESNTQDYLDRVAATELAALASPEGQAELQAARAAYGGLIDREATRNAIESRLAAGQKAAVQQGQFDDFTTERNQREAVDQLRGMAATGDNAGVERILGEQAFLNEGALRAELAGVRDNLQQNQYRANAEGRAQRAEQRSAASHALSMESGRENLNYSKAMHSEGIRKLNEQRLGEAAASAVLDEQNTLNQQQNEALAVIARDNNTSIMPDGTIDMSILSPETAANVRKQITDAGLGKVDETSARKRLDERLKAEGVSVAGRKTAIDQYELGRQLQDLAPEDRARADSMAAAAAAPMKAEQQRLTDEYNRRSTNNPFTAPPQDVNAEAAKLVDGAAKRYDSDWLTTDVNQRSLMDAAAKVMQNGVSVTLDGKEMNLVVPPSLVDRAIREVGANVFAKEGPEVAEAIERILKKDSGLQKQAKEAQTAQQTYQNDMSKLNSDILKAQSAVLRSQKRDKGVTVSANDWINAALRRN